MQAASRDKFLETEVLPSWGLLSCGEDFFVIFFVFSGFARLKEANPERHPAPERCRYASVVTCNAHHVSHVEGLMHTTNFGGLGGLQHQPASLCQPLPPVARRQRLWEPTSTRASRCAPTSPLSPSEDRLRISWEGFGEDFGEDFWRGNFGEDFGEDFLMDFLLDFFCRSPCGLLAKKSPLKNPPKNPHQNPHRKIRTEKSAPKNPHQKSAPKNPHRKIRTKNPHQKSAHKNPHTKIRTQNSKESVHGTQSCFHRNLSQLKT